MKKELDCKQYIESNKKEQELFANFITLDIETYLQDNVHIPYLVCMFDGQNEYSYHIKDYESLDLLFEQLFKDLVRPEYDDYNVYIHNSSRFDIIFMLKHIVKYCEAELIYKNNKFISVKLQKTISKDKKISINIFDSYLILLSSLSSLGKTFNVDVQKSTFPHKFVNQETLEYQGNIPGIDFFYFKDKNEMNDIISHIESYTNSWDCKTESIDYCINDCISLYQIVRKFSELIYEKFRIHIKNNPTLPSIAMKNYITNYMPTKEVTTTKINKKGEETTVTRHISNIPQLPKEVYDKIKPSYYGGHSDAYIPQFTNNITVPIFNGEEDYLEFKNKIQTNFKNGMYKTIKLYDVNSLYPSVMREFKMPTKLLYEFTGNILLEELNLLNEVKDQSKIVICNAKITAPNIARPVLPFRIANTTIYGYGEWTGMYTLLELLEAEKRGYSFTITSGFVFEAEDIFTDYVESLNEIKVNSPKKSAMYHISKISLNSLYGRWGLDPLLDGIDVVDDDGLEKLSKIVGSDKISDVGKFDNLYMVNVSDCVLARNCNIAIATCISSYSRIKLHETLNDQTYYTDTDSVFTPDFLPDNMEHDKHLGFWKLEAEIVEAVFLNSKVYGYITSDGEIIVKIKGYKYKIPFEELRTLLIKGNEINLTHQKWKTDFVKGSITVKDPNYLLKVNSNKRNLTYVDNKLSCTSNKNINSS